ncbi:MAG: hypothetical protein ACRD33_00150 [Candidatus Acidiferrales bacterium]
MTFFIIAGVLVLMLTAAVFVGNRIRANNAADDVTRTLRLILAEQTRFNGEIATDVERIQDKLEALAFDARVAVELANKAYDATQISDGR